MNRIISKYQIEEIDSTQIAVSAMADIVISYKTKNSKEIN